MSIIFLTNIHKEVLSVEDAHKKQSNLFKESSDINKGEKPIKTSLKKSFLKNVRFLFDAGEKLLNSFKSNIFHWI